jgi:solute carrier family 25 (mitochondrial 2-oxodicarboxylate transporter), member 21
MRLLSLRARATKFAANDEWTKFFSYFYGTTTINQKLSILTGAATGATEAFVVVPFELVKIRLQDNSHALKHKGAFDCVAKIIRQEGCVALYHGLESTMWRHIVWNAGYFGCIFQVRTLLPTAVSKSEKTRNDFLAGSVGGMVGTILNTPLDVVKTRIQSAPQFEGAFPKYNWAWPALRTIYLEEGYRSLYKGLVPKIARFGPGGGILLVVYTEALGLFTQARGKVQ